MDKTGLNFFKDLKALSETTFPKKCAVCRKSYATLKQFVEATSSLNGKSGMKASLDDKNEPIVDLFRNCACGSTLMYSFGNRRDISAKGKKRRELFGRLLAIMTKKGVKESRARAELLNFIDGRPSPLLEKMGIKAKKSDP